MSKRHWILVTIMIWIAVVAFIAGCATSRLMTRALFGSTYSHCPTVLLDGKPAYGLTFIEESAVGTIQNSAWTRRTYYVIPEDLLPPASIGDPTRHWEAIAIDEPFTLTFRKPDGTITGPHRIEFPDRGEARWAEDGLRLTFHSGSMLFLRRPFRPEGRIWHVSVLRTFILKHLGLILLAGFAIATTSGFIWRIVTTARQRPPHCCQLCGYDLRGCDDHGCPECGEGRFD